MFELRLFNVKLIFNVNFAINFLPTINIDRIVHDQMTHVILLLKQYDWITIIINKENCVWFIYLNFYHQTTVVKILVNANETLQYCKFVQGFSAIEERKIISFIWIFFLQIERLCLWRDSKTVTIAKYCTLTLTQKKINLFALIRRNFWFLRGTFWHHAECYHYKKLLRLISSKIIN